MPLFDILHLRVFWNTALGKPFIDVPFPVTNDGRLVDIIREEVLRTAIGKSGKGRLEGPLETSNSLTYAY